MSRKIYKEETIKTHVKLVLYGNVLREIRPLEDLYTLTKHKRMHVFINKGLQCATCHRKGTMLLVTINPKDGSRHIDLYTDDLTLMTVDHIVPKKKAREMGWSGYDIESLDNKQPMCQVCNSEKSDQLITNKEFVENRSKVPPLKRIAAIELLRELAGVESRIGGFRWISTTVQSPTLA